MVNSNDCLLRESSRHASVAYNSIGKHLELSKLKTTSSEAKRPTVPYTALKTRLETRDLTRHNIIYYPRKGCVQSHLTYLNVVK